MSLRTDQLVLNIKGLPAYEREDLVEALMAIERFADCMLQHIEENVYFPRTEVAADTGWWDYDTDAFCGDKELD